MSILNSCLYNCRFPPFCLNFLNESHLLYSGWYLPVRLIKKNEIFLAHEEIKFILDPTDDFSEFYINTVEKVKALFELRDSMDDLEETIEDIVIRNFKDLDTSNMTKQ